MTGRMGVLPGLNPSIRFLYEAMNWKTMCMFALLAWGAGCDSAPGDAAGQAATEIAWEWPAADSEIRINCSGCSRRRTSWTYGR